MKQDGSERRLITLGTLGVTGAAYARSKPLALLAFLSLEGPQARRRLAALFWPKAADPLNQLSLTLSRLGKELPGACRTDAKLVEAQIGSDAALLRLRLNEGAVEEAAELYAGEFLRAVDVRAVSSELREWLDDTRDDLARSLQHALVRRAAAAAQQGSVEGAAALVRRAVRVRDISLLDADDLLFAHDALALARDPAAQRLRVEAEDLGLKVEPRPRAIPMRLEAGAQPRLGTSCNHRWPGMSGRLVGRRAERRRLLTLLAAERCRLVTITGPGGVGKSRLATAVAHDAPATSSFPGGTVYVPCDGLEAAADVRHAIIEALGNAAPSAGLGPRHLADELARRAETLLVLDDLDHHLPHAGWLLELLRAAPGVSVLVTAQRPVGSAGEHVLPLAGLAAAGEVGELFHAHARRADAGFDLRPDDAAALAELGRLTRGNPLALALAAAWVPVMSVAEIAEELAVDLEILATDAHDVPPRHRSMVASFQHTWDLLGPADHDRLLRLSVLRGSFDRATAAAVGHLTLPELAGLAKKSLLIRTARGRFECQPLFRRWVADRIEPLQERPAVLDPPVVSAVNAMDAERATLGGVSRVQS